MSHLDPGQLTTQPSGIRTGTALSNPDLLGQARDYKKNVASRFRLLKEGQIRELSNDGLYVSVKLDGQLHFLYKDDDEIFLFNPRGRVITDLPLLEKARELLPKGQLLLAGELYATGSDRSRVYAVTSALGSQPDAPVDQLAYGAFDLLSRDGDSWTALSYGTTQEELAKLLPPIEGPIHHIAQEEADVAAISTLFNKQVVDGGQEGLVVLSDPTHTIYKIKQRHDIDAAIIGYTERPDEPGAVRVLLTALMRPDGSFQVLAKVGGGIEDDLRRELYRTLSPLAVDSQYMETDRNHTLFTMVRPRHVVQIGFHDLLTETSDGKPQLKANLHFDPDTGYQVQVPERFVSLIFPTFRKLRDDKEIDPDDLRLTQLQDFVDLDNLQAPARPMEMAASEILQRDVYVKVTKGLKAVRKFVSWKTNKDDLDASYPPYAFCYVDYSPGRASPLKRNVRIAQSEDGIRAIHQSYLDNEVKRGWKLPSELDD